MNCHLMNCRFDELSFDELSFDKLLFDKLSRHAYGQYRQEFSIKIALNTARFTLKFNNFPGNI